MGRGGRGVFSCLVVACEATIKVRGFEEDVPGIESGEASAVDVCSARAAGVPVLAHMVVPPSVYPSVHLTRYPSYLVWYAQRQRVWSFGARWIAVVWVLALVSDG